MTITDDATTYKRVPFQRFGPQNYGRTGWRVGDDKLQNFDWHDFGVIMSEDCGMVDITTPWPKRGANLPVIVKFHGGNNVGNTRMLPRYTGERLPGAVVVHADFPLSMFGFGTHAAFGNDHQPNRAYEFMVATLEWVQMWISEFGSDPNSVLIEGSSSGAAAVNYLMPQGGTLFHNAVAHCGGGHSIRPLRFYIQTLMEQFWQALIKDKPAHFDRSRTIAQIAATDGVAAALRLGPSPDQMMSWWDSHTAYAFSGGSWSRYAEGFTDIWPVSDGVILQERSAAQEVIAGRWPLSVGYMGGFTSNEASVVGNAREVSDPEAYLARVGIVAEPQISQAIEMMSGRRDYGGDLWPRFAYGACTFGYGTDRLCREFTAKGGRAYYVYFDYDSYGNGRVRPGHVGQHPFFSNKPAWAVSQGDDPATLQLFEDDLAMAAWCSGSLIRMAATGDPNSDWVSPFDLDLYAPGELPGFADWQTYGAARNANIIRRNRLDQTVPGMEVQQGHWADLWDFFDTTMGY